MSIAPSRGGAVIFTPSPALSNPCQRGVNYVLFIKAIKILKGKINSLSVCNSTFLNNKRMFLSESIWFIFNLREINKKNPACTNIFIYLRDYSLALRLLKRGHTWAASMVLVLMQIGPPPLHFNSRLTTSPSSVDGTVCRHLHTVELFPRSLIGLAFPDLGAWLKVLGSYMRTYNVASIITCTYTVTSITTSTVRQHWQCTLAQLHYFDFVSEDWSDSLAQIFLFRTLRFFAQT